MSTFLEYLSAAHIPFGLLIIATVLMVFSWRKTGWVGEFINSLNAMNTPWIAIIVMVLGMIYNLQCKKYGLDADSANQVIGAGIGLLTGQALANRNGNPIPPVEPAKQETK
jgi:hypothetical protein